VLEWLMWQMEGWPDVRAGHHFVSLQQGGALRRGALLKEAHRLYGVPIGG
jgi:hypothetical protein